MRSGIAAAERALCEELGRVIRTWPPLVCFANDWHGDPTSKHHIMRAFAEHTDVLWVESAGMRAPKLTNVMDLRRISERLRRSAAGVRSTEGRLRVASPLSIPLPASALARRVNALLYRRVVRRAVGAGVARKPLLWVYAPTVAHYLEGLPRSGLVYHCVDRWWAFADYDADAMRACHAKLCREADVVFASSVALLEDCRLHTDRAYLVPHGVDWAHFAQAALTPPPRPADIADVHAPVVGFFGLLHEWLDQDLIVALAAALPDATIVLIGKRQVDVSRLAVLPNIRLVGQKPYAELPAYAAAFDVGIIPFVINELTVAVNPIKLREYLSAGLPVVASALPEVGLLAANPSVRVAVDTPGFIDAVRAFLAPARGAEERRAGALRLARDSWAGRCVEMARLVQEHTSL